MKINCSFCGRKVSNNSRDKSKEHSDGKTSGAKGYWVCHNCGGSGAINALANMLNPPTNPQVIQTVLNSNPRFHRHFKEYFEKHGFLQSLPISQK